MGGAGFEPPTFRSLDNPLYLLSHSRSGLYAFCSLLGMPSFSFQLFPVNFFILSYGAQLCSITAGKAAKCFGRTMKTFLTERKCCCSIYVEVNVNLKNQTVLFDFSLTCAVWVLSQPQMEPSRLRHQKAGPFGSFNTGPNASSKVPPAESRLSPRLHGK